MIAERLEKIGDVVDKVDKLICSLFIEKTGPISLLLKTLRKDLNVFEIK